MKADAKSICYLRECRFPLTLGKSQRDIAREQIPCFERLTPSFCAARAFSKSLEKGVLQPYGLSMSRESGEGKGACRAPENTARFFKRKLGIRAYSPHIQSVVALSS